jgi:hypothetical protein
LDYRSAKRFSLEPDAKSIDLCIFLMHTIKHWGRASVGARLAPVRDLAAQGCSHIFCGCLVKKRTLPAFSPNIQKDLLPQAAEDPF